LFHIRNNFWCVFFVSTLFHVIFETCVFFVFIEILDFYLYYYFWVCGISHGNFGGLGEKKIIFVFFWFYVWKIGKEFWMIFKSFNVLFYFYFINSLSFLVLFFNLCLWNVLFLMFCVWDFFLLEIFSIW